ncbi:hypothetical protein [Streptomyces sp. NRRL B-1347]|uniref:hypothetical protein n=1 Tax=Streptomyces sp. NRRL B-1347 TaxID=1476877 RepID=UPI0004C8B929|nr:hypothetical protein [Streptomyces sp. NRRL B-1347]
MTVLLAAQLATSGPALFYLPDMADDSLTITRIDIAAPTEPAERQVCRALIAHALDVEARGERTRAVTDDGPTIIYAGTNKRSVWHVDQTVVDGPRERCVCRSLLKEALALCDQHLVRVDEKGPVAL